MYSNAQIAAMVFFLANAFMDFGVGCLVTPPILSAACGFASAICLVLFLLTLMIDEEE